MWHSIRPRLILISLLVFLLLFIVSLNNRLLFINDILNDWLIQYIDQNRHINNVVIIKTPEKSTKNTEEWWKILIAKIQQGDPQLIAFNFIPEKLYNTYTLKSEENIILSNRIKKDYFENEKIFLANSNVLESNFYLNTQITSDSSVYRNPTASIDFYGRVHNTLTNAISTKLVGKPILENDYIDFSMPPDTVPKLRIERVYNADIDSNLFKNKVILLTLGYPQPEAKIRVPLGNTQTLAEFQSAIINTAINQTWSRTADTIFSLFIILIIAITSFIILYRLSPIQCLAITTLAIITHLFIAWFSLRYFSLRLPLADMLLTQCITLIISLIYRHTNTTQLLASIAHESLEKRIPLKHVNRLDNENWLDIVKLVKTLLPVSQSVFLQRSANQNNLQIYELISCKKIHIIEQRRNYHSEPYSNATNAGKPIKLSDPFIEPQNDNQQQYIVALVFAHQILGFWVYNLEYSCGQNPNQQNTLINKTAKQIAEHLYHNHYKNKQAIIPKAGFWQKYSAPEGTDLAPLLLKNAIKANKAQTDLAQQIINDSSSCIIVYNLTGELIQTNEAATTLFEKTDIRLFEGNILDIMGQLTGLSQSECRHYYQYTIFKCQTTSMPITISQFKDYSLRLKPLKAQTSNESNRFFNLQGIFIELINLRKVNDVYNLRDNIINQFIAQLRTQLGTMTMAMRQMEETKDLHALQTKLLPIIQRQLYKSFNAAAQIHLTLQKIDINIDINICPSDSLTQVKNCISKITPHLQARDITITTEFPAKATLAIIDHQRFHQIIYDLLNILIKDAAENTEIKISLHEYNLNGRFLEYRFTTEGFGLANGQLQDFIDNKDSALSTTMKKIKEASQEIHEWGGQFTMNSEFGEGISATLILRGYSVHDDITNKKHHYN